MALLTFPSNPVDGDLYPLLPTVGQNQYQWESAAEIWRLVGPSVGVAAGTYGSSTSVPQITVDVQGRVSSVVNVAIDANVKYVSAPANSAVAGSVGQVAFGLGYFYFYDGAQWLRIAGSTF